VSSTLKAESLYSDEYSFTYTLNSPDPNPLYYHVYEMILQQCCMLNCVLFNRYQ